MEAPTQPGRYRAAGKTAAISAAIFLVSLGLCGISVHAYAVDYVTILGLFSLFGMIGGALGLLGAAVSAIFVFFTSDPKEKP
jgi:hypothetical protein